MSRATLADRVAALEQQVRELLANRAQSGRKKDLSRLRGAFTGDDLIKQVFEEGRKIRETERRRVRARTSKKRAAHS